MQKALDSFTFKMYYFRIRILAPGYMKNYRLSARKKR